MRTNFPSHFKAAMDKKKLQIRIGQNIRTAREKKGISQAELARKCDREASWMARIEFGNINSSIYVLNLIAEALEVKLEEIVKLD